MIGKGVPPEWEILIDKLIDRWMDGVAGVVQDDAMLSLVVLTETSYCFFFFHN